MTAQPERRVVRNCRGCGRPVYADETPAEWAEQELKHHGPPPQAFVDLVRRIAKKNAPA